MIEFSNGHRFEYVVASGGLGFDGKGYPWEWLQIALGCMQPELFTVFLKTLTWDPVIGNLNWWHPWSCVALLKNGAANKVGLTNKGIHWWMQKVAPKLNYKKYALVASIAGNEEQLVEMARLLDRFELKGIELNPFCPNTPSLFGDADSVIRAGRRVAAHTRHPIIMKLSVVHEYLKIAHGLYGAVQAISLNSVPWEMVFPDMQSPLCRVGQGGKGGGVSGKPAQKFNWPAVEQLAKQGMIPVIGPSVMEFEDMDRVRELGAKAVSFGAIHLPDHSVWLKPWTIFTNPCKPTAFIRREQTSCQ